LLQYWRFYWPLGLMGLAMVLSVQFQNAALARYPEAVTELAVFALAYSTFGFFRASLNFIAQLSNVFARSPTGTRRCHAFVVAASIVIMLPLILLLSAFTGAVVGIVLIVLRGRDRNVPIPFGPYLAAAGWIAMMWGPQIVGGYLSLAGLDR